MGNALSESPALKRLHSRLVALSGRGRDLLDGELKDAKASCMHAHYGRIWEQLEPSERKAIRDEVMKDVKINVTRESFIEGFCVTAIENHFQSGRKISGPRQVARRRR
jgi:hypothetical protein